MDEIVDYFHFEDQCESFEDFGHENGSRTWFARDLMAMLGYESFSSFENAVNRASQACMTLKIPVMDNFTQVERELDGRKVKDYKLSRFACYLAVMNGDVRKPQVAKAQAYFAAMAEALRQHIRDVEDMDRILVRDEVSERERSLSGTAKIAGVQNYAFFQDQGYRGLYNMSLRSLRDRKGVNPKDCLLDFMGKEELAANFFRITQTEAKIKSERVRGQVALEKTAYVVGRKVRDTIKDIGGTMPEDLRIAEDISVVKKRLKQAHKELTAIDKPKKRKRLAD